MTTLITIIAVVVGLLIVYVVVFVDIMGERLFDRVLRAVGLSSGEGPLAVHATHHGGRLVLTIRSEGAHPMGLAAVEGRSESGKRIFPSPSLDEGDPRTPEAPGAAQRAFSKVRLGPGESMTVYLDPDELAETNCRSLAILDATGRAWPVEGFDGASLG
jgi:hypothetical protein